MSPICRGCAGTGIGTHVSPREAQVAQTPIIMRREPDAPAVRLVVQAEASKARMFFSGPIARVLEEIELRKLAGYQFDLTECVEPDPAHACDWCNGHGTAEGVLTLHTMMEAVRATT